MFLVPTNINIIIIITVFILLIKMYPCGFGSFLTRSLFLCMYMCSNKKDDWPETLLLSLFLSLNSTLTWLKHSQTTESKKQLPLFQQNVITHSQLGPKGSEVIGWRLATQESCSGFHFTKELSPAVLNKSPSKGQFVIDTLLGVYDIPQTLLHAWLILSFENSGCACRNIPG